MAMVTATTVWGSLRKWYSSNSSSNSRKTKLAMQR
jgi:hypothetical protein